MTMTIVLSIWSEITRSGSTPSLTTMLTWPLESDLGSSPKTALPSRPSGLTLGKSFNLCFFPRKVPGEVAGELTPPVSPACHCSLVGMMEPLADSDSLVLPARTVLGSFLLSPAEDPAHTSLWAVLFPAPTRAPKRSLRELREHQLLSSGRQKH